MIEIEGRGQGLPTLPVTRFHGRPREEAIRYCLIPVIHPVIIKHIMIPFLWLLSHCLRSRPATKGVRTAAVSLGKPLALGPTMNILHAHATSHTLYAGCDIELEGKTCTSAGALPTPRCCQHQDAANTKMLPTQACLQTLAQSHSRMNMPVV